jgi:hypothetical protein
MRLPPLLEKVLGVLRSDRSETLEGLRSDIRQLISAIRDHESAYREQEHETESLIDNLPDRIIRAQKKVQHYEEREQSSHKYLNLWIQAGLVIGTWLAFIAAFVYAGITFMQLKEMIRAADANVKAANAAIQANIDSDTHFRLEQRPYMVVRSPDIMDMGQFSAGERAFVTSHLENIGHSIAFNTRFLPVVEIIDRDTKELEIRSLDDLTTPIDQAFQKDVIERMLREERNGFKHPMRDMAPGFPSELGGHLDRPVSGRNMIGIITGRSFVIFLGTVHYDAFGSEHHLTEFCWFMTKPVLNQATKRYDYAWVLCKDHNIVH